MYKKYLDFTKENLNSHPSQKIINFNMTYSNYDFLINPIT